jgi:hypothetical protein
MEQRKHTTEYLQDNAKVIVAGYNYCNLLPAICRPFATPGFGTVGRRFKSS